MRHLFWGSGGERSIADTFNRANTTPATSGQDALGRTSTGGIPWRIMSGSWQILSNRAVSGTSGSSNPFIVLDVDFSDLDISASVGAGGDAIYARVTDANNWIRLRTRWYENRVNNPIYVPAVTETQYQWRAFYGPGVGGLAPFEGPYPKSFPDLQHSHSEAFTQYGAQFTSPFTGPLSHKHLVWDEFSVPFSNILHSHPITSNTKTGATQQVVIVPAHYEDNFVTTQVYAALLEKNVAGTVTTLRNHVLNSTPISLAMNLEGTSVTILANGGTLSVTTVSDHRLGLRHGLGRAISDKYDHGFDNFTLTAI